MRKTVEQERGLRPISPGYLGSLAAAMLGLVFACIGVGAISEARLGHDQDLALDEYGVPAFLFAGAIGFTFRLIFWRRIPPVWQGRVRTLMTLIVGLEVTGVIAVVAWFFRAAPPQASGLGGTAGSTILLAALGQVGSVIWLVRYRHE